MRWRVGAAARAATGSWPGGAATARRPRARASGPTSLLCGVYNNFELLTTVRNARAGRAGSPKSENPPQKNLARIPVYDGSPRRCCSIRGPPEQPAQVVDHKPFVVLVVVRSSDGGVAASCCYQYFEFASRRRWSCRGFSWSRLVVIISCIIIISVISSRGVGVIICGVE